MDRGIDETPNQEELQNPKTESSLDPILAPVVTRKGRPFFTTLKVENPNSRTAPVYGAPRRSTTSTTTCDTAITDPNEETEIPGYTGPHVFHPSDHHVGRHGP